MTHAPHHQPGSLIRAVIGAVALLVSLVTITAGFVILVAALQNDGYGTDAVLTPIAVLTVGGGLLALGVGLIIWEVSIRYGIRK